ncbi:hypothetical protein EC968_005128 [Mortierella alpina]|nr:hypothetical protein EC968_005128 [Mortierella alpina]
MSVSWLPSPLIPPFRFGTVEPEVYRGAYPKQRNLRYLKRLKLRTILSLIPDAPDEVFRQFCEDQGIKSIHLPVDKVKDNVPLTYNRAVEAVQIIIDPENLPIYIHCLDGASVTGLVVCCLRKLQTWNISSAMGEFLRYLRGGVISSEESVFVEKFASEIEISKPIPPWLWEGHITFKKHPSLKLNFTIPPSAASASNATPFLAPSPTLSHQNSAAVFPSLQNDGYNGGPHSSNNMANSATSGTTTGGTSTTGLTGQASAVSGAGSTAGTGTSLPSSAAGLINHASRSSAKATLRDRPGHNKSMIRTDSATTGFGPRNTSIATPTTATLARNKRAMVGSQSGLAQQSSTLQPDQPVIETLGSPSGLGVRLNGQPSTDSRSTSGVSADMLVKSSSTNVVSQVNENGTSIGGDSGANKDISHTEINSAIRSDDQKAGETTVLTSATQQDRTPTQHQSMAKTSPAQTATAQPVAPQEPVEEYYEVSMTLKALALEGADF